MATIEDRIGHEGIVKLRAYGGYFSSYYLDRNNNPVDGKFINVYFPVQNMLLCVEFCLLSRFQIDNHMKLGTWSEYDWTLFTLLWGFIQYRGGGLYVKEP